MVEAADATPLCRIGESPATGTLGRTAVAGSRIWDCRQRFRIVLGPMGGELQRLLPGAKSGSIERLVALVARTTSGRSSRSTCSSC